MVSRSTRIAGSSKLRLNLLGIEHVEEHDFIAVETQRLDGAHDRLGRFEEIGNDQHEAAAPEKFLEVMQRLGESVRARGSASSRPLSRR